MMEGPYILTPPPPRLVLVSAGLLPCHYEFEIVLPLHHSSPKSNIYATVRQEVHTATQEGVTSGINSFMPYGRLKTQMGSPELAVHPHDGAYQQRSTFSDLPLLLRR